MTAPAHKAARRPSGLFFYNSTTALLRAGLDLVFPPRCAGCDRADAAWCPSCQQALAAVPIHVSLHSTEGLQQVAATGLHEGLLQQAIQALKYEHVPELAGPLGLRLDAALQSLGWIFDIIVPVPLHTSRLRERGYNQAQLLAGVIAETCQRPCTPQAIVRTRNTRAQVGLNREERLHNMVDAFESLPEHTAGRTILLVDDVHTTGSTLAGCAGSALNSGAKAVYGLTVSVARLRAF